jgi:hypothetical protein
MTDAPVIITERIPLSRGFSPAPRKNLKRRKLLYIFRQTPGACRHPRAPGLASPRRLALPARPGRPPHPAPGDTARSKFDRALPTRLGAFFERGKSREGPEPPSRNGLRPRWAESGGLAVCPGAGNFTAERRRGSPEPDSPGAAGGIGDRRRGDGRYPSPGRFEPRGSGGSPRVGRTVRGSRFFVDRGAAPGAILPCGKRASVPVAAPGFLHPRAGRWKSAVPDRGAGVPIPVSLSFSWRPPKTDSEESRIGNSPVPVGTRERSSEAPARLEVYAVID